MDCIIRGVTNLCPTTARATVEDLTRTCIQSEGNLPAPRWPQMVYPERERVPHPWGNGMQAKTGQP